LVYYMLLSFFNHYNILWFTIYNWWQKFQKFILCFILNAKIIKNFFGDILSFKNFKNQFF
jgi:hypothetical protein